MEVFDFDERLAFSKGQRAQYDDDTLKAMVPSAVAVEEATRLEDRHGVDKIVELSSGRRLAVDLKVREKGASRYWWEDEPELALERWSVVPGSLSTNPERQAIGWTLDSAKQTDLVLFLFDASDTTECFLVGFHHLRAAFQRFGPRWMQEHRVAEQTTIEGSRRYESQCVFVPADSVLDAITAVSRGRLNGDAP